jgi:hypothetical protein
MNKQEFFEKANGNHRTRLFDETDYQNYSKALAAAKNLAKRGEACYFTGDAGGVANSYSHVTNTAQWAVWTAPDGQVIEVVRRCKTASRHVSAAFRGGEKAYRRWFNSAVRDLLEKLSRPGADAATIAEWFHTICANERG